MTARAELGSYVEPIYRTLGREIRKHRIARGLTQEALALCLKPPQTRQSIANMEAGRQRIPVHVLVHIARALGFEVRL